MIRKCLPALFAALLAAASTGRAAEPPKGPELELAHIVDPKEDQIATKPLPFEPSDFLRLAIDPMKTKYFLGEPVILKLRLVNHTQFTVKAITNFNPRANLEITIVPENERARRTYGPYSSGTYPTDQALLYPLEEIPIQVMLWGDLETENGLVFPKPGRYLVRLLLDVGVKNGARGKIPPLDSANLKPINQFMIEVLPAPADWAPLVEKLSASKAFALLHVRNAPEGLYAELPDLIKQYPATPISPYLNFALGLRYNLESKAQPEDKELPIMATEQIQRTAMADSYYKAEAWESLLTIYDRTGASEPAYQAAVELLKAVPPGVAARKGTSDLVKRYLKNSAEMNPIRYWDLLQ